MMRWCLTLIICLVLLGACLADNSKVALSSQGHILEEVATARVAIKDASGATLIVGVMGMQLQDDYVYGWINDADESSSYFLLSLKNNKVEQFAKMDHLNKRLSSLGLKLSSMKDEITYWDIREKGAKSVDEYLSSTKRK